MSASPFLHPSSPATPLSTPRSNAIRTHASKSLHSIAAIAGSLLLLATAPSHSDDCNELIRLGLHNVQNNVSVHDSLTAAYRLFCEASYSSSSSSRRSSMEASFSVFGFFGIGGGGGRSSSLTQTEWDKVCEDDDLREELYAYELLQSETIFQGSLDAWERCLSLNARGLETDIRPTSDSTGGSFDLYWTGSGKADFLGIDQPDLGPAECTVTTAGKNGLSAAPVLADTQFKLSTKAANFSCMRSVHALSDGTLGADALRLTVKTSDGSFDIDMPPLALRQVGIGEMDSIHERMAEISAINERLEELDARVDMLEAVNVSEGKPARPGSYYQSSVSANRATDGSRNGNWTAGSVAHTNKGATGNWWEVDLGRRHQIRKIKVWKRTDCCTHQIKGAKVYLGDTPYTGSPAGMTYVGTMDEASPSQTFRFETPITGRYVVVKHAGRDWMTLAEVEVYSNPQKQPQSACRQAPFPEPRSGSEYASNDNPFSESHFKTLKLRPDFPEQFGSINHPRRSGSTRRQRPKPSPPSQANNTNPVGRLFHLH